MIEEDMFVSSRSLVISDRKVRLISDGKGRQSFASQY